MVSATEPALLVAAAILILGLIVDTAVKFQRSQNRRWERHSNARVISELRRIQQQEPNKIVEKTDSHP